MQHSIDKLTTVFQNISRMTWFTTISQTPSLASTSFPNPSIHITGNTKQNLPAKTPLLDLLPTSPNPNPTLPSLTPSPAMVLYSPGRRIATPAPP